MKNGVPYTCSELSTAIERPAVSGTPWAPMASPSSDNPAMRKNTNDRFWRRTSSALCGLVRIHSRMRSNRHLFARDEFALDENTANRNVWVSVVGIVGDA